MDKNFKFDIINKSFIIGNLVFNHATKQEDVSLFGYEFYHDYQDKYIYTVKQRIIYKEHNLSATVVFKGSKIWLIDIKHEKDETIDDSYKNLYEELRKDMLSLNNPQLTKIEVKVISILSLEFITT